MASHPKAVALLAAGIVLGIIFSLSDTSPFANAQTKSQHETTATKDTLEKKSTLPPSGDLPVIFPATDDPEIARIYATAYIVGEALRAGLIEEKTVDKETRVENCVNGVYRRLGGN